MERMRGFTLIELLVVIAVLGILATVVLVFVDPLGQINKANIATAQSQMRQMVNEIEGIRVLQNKTMRQITGSGCTECVCSCIDSRTSTCMTPITTSWSKLSTTTLPTDPWGNPYMFDENEQENVSTDCRYDIVRSPGPDHIKGATACIDNGADDISIQVSHFRCP